MAVNQNEYTVCEGSLISAFRYALGKRNYVVGEVVSDLASNAESISSKTRQMMIKEIAEKWQVNALGHQTDTTMWVHLMQQLQGIEEKGRLL
jgi:hypothetical protein